GAVPRTMDKLPLPAKIHLDKHKLRASSLAFQREVTEKMSALATAAFGLVAALAWNNAIQSIFKRVYPQPDDPSAIAPLLGFAAERGRDARGAHERARGVLHEQARLDVRRERRDRAAAPELLHRLMERTRVLRGAARHDEHAHLRRQHGDIIHERLDARVPGA